MERNISQKTEEDFNFCQNCQKASGITEEKTCSTCGDRICLYCGCTDSHACPDGCHWVRPGLCSACADTEAAGIRANQLRAGMKL